MTAPQLDRATKSPATRLFRRLAAAPAGLPTWLAESALSRRALAAGLVLTFAYLALSPWLRPPMLRDIRGPRLPYAVFSGHAFQPADVVAPRVDRIDSVAAPIVLLCAIGLVAVLVNPKLFPVVSGGVAALAIAGTAAVMLNHPKLIESFSQEYRQRLNLQRVLRVEREYNVASLIPTRIDTRLGRYGLFPIEFDPEDPKHAWYFLVWSPWLVLLALGATAASTRGAVGRRAAAVCVWALIGTALAAGATHRRLAAEWLWAEAERAEFANRCDDAHAALDRLASVFPDFADTRRMLLTRGRLDARAGRETPYAELFLATQKNIDDGANAEFDRVLAALPSSYAARDLAASTCFNMAAEAHGDGRSAAAQQLWREGLTIAPWRLDCRIAHAAATEKIEVTEPGRVAALLLPHLENIGDRILRADLLAIIGDSYLEARQIQEGRRYFAEAIDAFSLPKLANPYAQEAMLGM